ncbi:MAG: hypothetical protein QNJ71_11470 [Acidimicrobiia bacterium]|nr:hypothetical protein [Acidimicrobiia bacterium]
MGLRRQRALVRTLTRSAAANVCGNLQGPLERHKDDMAALTLITAFSVIILVAARFGQRFVESRIGEIQNRR